jgi:putative heme-binding domain-containing protein
MSDAPEPSANPRRIWPWFVLAGVVLAAVLAFLWVSAEVRRLKSIERFDYRLPAKAPPPIVPSSTNPPVPASTNALIAGFVDALTGGDSVAGRNIFFNKPEASCGKCHRVGNEGGDNGPALDGIGSRQTREFILESMVAPNATVTKGFETVVVRLKNGSGLSGVLRKETETNLVLHTPDDGPVTVNKSDVTERFVGVSPMPADFPTLISKQAMRDLMAFLVSLTTNAPAGR